MKTIALISGGKDSILSILIALRYGHQPIVLGNIAPTCKEGPEHIHEIDSYSFQTVGHEVVECIATCLQLPLRRAYIEEGQSKFQELHYNNSSDDEDEVETLYRLLKSIKEEFPDVEGVTTGAILSHYQRHRVENVCKRLSLISLAFLWQRSAEEILDMTTTLHVKAILIKTASIGLDPRQHLGLTLKEVRPVLEKAQKMYGTHSAGEGGEFETIVLNCPLFIEKYLEIASFNRVIVDDNDYSPSGHLELKVHLREKTMEEKNKDADILKKLPLLKFPSDQMKNLPCVEELMKLSKYSFKKIKSCEINKNFWNCNFHVYNSETEFKKENIDLNFVNILEQIIKEISEINHEIYFLLVFSPSIEYLNNFNNVFGNFFNKAQPPGCTFIENSEIKSLRIEVLSAPQTSINRSTLNVQSISCFSSPTIGPYSFSNFINLENEQRVIVSGSIGLVPVTQKLATREDLIEIPSLLFTQLNEITKIKENLLQKFIVEFSFMYANSIIGLTHFGMTPRSVTHITFFLKDMKYSQFLLPLWQCCSKDTRNFILFDNNNNNNNNNNENFKIESAMNVVEYRLLHVSQLPYDALVEVILERRFPYSEN